MKLAWLVLSALVVVALGGCQQEVVTNTPQAAAIIERSSQAIATSLLTLARNPGAFEGQDLILAGRYRPLPLPVCVDELHPSPATWTLGDGDIEILVSGYDGALRELASPGLPLEVEGRWQKWEGPVGCGRRAPTQLVWHLQLTNILSPNPLSASLPFTPEPVGPGTAVAAAGAATDAAAGVATISAGSTATIAGTSALSNGAFTATPGLPGQQTPGVVATPGLTGSATGTVSSTPSQTLTGSGTPSTTPFGTGTPTPSFATPTPRDTSTPSGSSTPTPTATSSSGSSPTPTVDSGRPILIDYDDISKRTITAGSTQEWQFGGAVDFPIFVRVAPSSGLDVALELLDPTDERVGLYDQGGAGQPETVSESNLPSSGLYTLRVSAVDQSAGSYAVVLQSESSRPFVLFQGILEYGETRAGTTPVDGDHLWNFEGVAGDVVTVLVIATTPSDMQIYLNSHDGQETEFENDNTVYFPPEDREEFVDFRLPATGLYTIGIGEEDLEALGYVIVVERS